MTGARYRLVVEGELSARYAKAFEGMDVDSREGMTFICGTVADRAHLRGLLDRIENLGIQLVSVAREDGETPTT